MSGFQIFVKNCQFSARAESPLNFQCRVAIITRITLPGVELQPVVIPGLPEVAVDAKHLLELVNGPNVADGEVQDDLHRLSRAVLWPHLFVVTLLHQQVVQGIGYLKREGSP